MDRERTSDQALVDALKVHRRLLVRGSSWTLQANKATARNVLEQELGQFEDRLPSYHLDQETRDRLLAHARQDAAHALLNTISLMEEFHSFKRSLAHATQGLFLLVLVFTAWKYWPLIQEWLSSVLR